MSLFCHAAGAVRGTTFIRVNSAHTAFQMLWSGFR